MYRDHQVIAILDCEMGNLQSVFHGIDSIGYDCEIIKSTELNDEYTHLVLPGVGNFHQVMSSKNIADIKNRVHKFAKTGKPILGICLGMQLLSDWGEEGGGTEGLGLIGGKVHRLFESKIIRLPHVGWNSVNFLHDHPLFSGLKNNLDFYFVHSYQFIPKHEESIYATTNHGNDFTSIVAERNIIGVQFHPEKSQSNGLKMLENFCAWDGKC